MCSYSKAEVRRGAMLKPHVPAYCEGYILHEQRKCSEGPQDIHRKLLLVSFNEHCMWVFIIPDVAVLAIEVSVSREESLISKQNVRGKAGSAIFRCRNYWANGIRARVRCEVVRLQSLDWRWYPEWPSLGHSTIEHVANGHVANGHETLHTVQLDTVHLDTVILDTVAFGH
ncbi:hypothetical protein RF55_11725, partial [Lasius niger]